jgi:glycosyltransferase involved in cell wall biosynthesis
MTFVFEQELTHYRVPVFARLQDALGDPVRVYHGAPPPGAHLKTVDAGARLPFAHRRLPTAWLGGDRLFVQQALPALAAAWRRPPRAVLLRHSVRNLALLPLVLAFRAQGVPVVLWGQGYSRTRAFDPGRHVADKLHLLLVQLADAYVGYTDAVRDTLARYVPPAKLFVANNTVDTTRTEASRRRLEAEGQAAVRARLGLARGAYLSFIGRLQRRKRLDLLVDAFARLRADGLDAGLLVIGDGPEREAVARRAADAGLAADAGVAADVHLLGARYGAEADAYLFASDAMVMPGALGLAVNHALLLGRPVVSAPTDDDGFEAVHLRDGATGRWAAAATPPALAAAVRDVLADGDAYAARARAYAAAHLGLDRMIDGFRAAFAYARASAARR